jgi:tRNA uridine 5-carboxymethylaminomethyl modification enzyme
LFQVIVQPQVFIHPKTYDVIVVGAGHAGIEASLAAARMGCSTLLLTHNADTIGQMSCNPAIGGSAKGHLVREIDALGGEMGKATDQTGIQFRLLNRSKGPAVWSPRAQCDKKAYQNRMKWVCEREPNLDLMQHQASGLVIRNNQVVGIETSLGVEFRGQCVVITTGTFLQGLLHFGSTKQAGGRSGDSVSLGLTNSLQAAGLEIGRFKTGTPPRLLRRSLDFGRMQRQDGDEPPPFFSHYRHYWPTTPELNSQNNSTHCSRHSTQTKHSLPTRQWDKFFSPLSDKGLFHVEQLSSNALPVGSLVSRISGQLPCYLTNTTPQTKEIVLRNLHLSAMYSGNIEGIGPRYCPSIEDKFVRFADKEQHQIFIEPEGVNTDEVYVNGCSSSLPFHVQLAMVRSIVGCEQAEILRPAYAVEYDYCPPTQLHPWLETKTCRNLFLGGQINGTSGYEEAAAQGLIAGINAARRVKDQAPFVLRRDQAYIGVLIDDLVTKGTTEPYRMFTSRVEHRLLLRQDNADLRLTPIGFELGLIPKELYGNYLQKEKSLSAELQYLKNTRVDGVTLWSLLRRPEVSYSQLPNGKLGLSEAIVQQLEVLAKYEGYISRQEAEVSKMAGLEGKHLPAWLDYSSVNSLRREAVETLTRFRPMTIGQASRLSGITPSDIGILLTWLKRAAPEPAAPQSKA